MTMSRTVSGLALSFALGAIASSLIIQWRISVNLNTEREATHKAELMLKEDFQKRENSLSAKITNLERDLDAALEVARKTEKSTPPSTDYPLALPEPSEPAAYLQSTLPEQEDESGRSRRGRWENLTAEEREARMERHREFVADFQERVNTFLGERMMQSPDAVEQDRIAALREYFDYMTDLRQQMHEAKTDEEHAQIEELMQKSGEEMTGLQREEQDYLLRQVAEEYGITDPQKQAEFVNRMQEFRHDPFFRGPMMPDGRGGGFRRWGGGDDSTGQGRNTQEGR
jgi:hypothetical protein